MKVTLNRANKIRNKLSSKSLIPDHFVSVRSDHPALEAIVAEASDLRVNTLRQMEESYRILFDLRERIQIANMEGGISALLVQIEHRKSLLKALKGVRSPMGINRGTTLESALLASEHYRKLADVDPAKVPPPQMVNVVVPFDVNSANEKENDISLQIEELEEKRNALNHVVFIEIPEADAKFLREIGII